MEAPENDSLEAVDLYATINPPVESGRNPLSPSIEPWTVIAKTRGPALNSTKFPTERKEKNSIILPIDARKVRLSTKEKEIFPMAEA